MGRGLGCGSCFCDFGRDSKAGLLTCVFEFVQGLVSG